MSETKHTPGPWEIAPIESGDKDIIIVEPGVALDYDDVDPEEQEANAHLIASAPELLEALKIALVHLPELPIICEKIDRAIAKAEGRE